MGYGTSVRINKQYNYASNVQTAKKWPINLSNMRLIMVQEIIPAF